MARAVKQPLGAVRGRVGDVIFRYMNGKRFISVYNGDVKISMSEKSIANRNKFGAAIKFAKAVNSVSDLKKVWDYSNAPGRSAYTKIYKENNKRIQPDSLSLLCTITPHGISYMLDSFNLDTKFATVKIKIDRIHEQNLIPPYTAHFVIFLSDPLNPELDSFTNYAFTSVRVEEETPDEFQTITSKFISPDSQLMLLYKKATAFFAITKTDTKPFEWLNTCSQEFILS